MLFTAACYFRPYEPASKVPGRRFFFLKASRALRRKFKNDNPLSKLAILIVGPEYAWNLIQLFLYCIVKRPIIHVQWAPIPLLDIVFLFLAKVLGLKIVYTVHNPLPHDKETPLNTFLYGTIYRLADRLIFHSKSNIDDFAQRFPRDENRQSVVPFGLPFEERPPRDRQEVRKRFGWADDEIVIVFQGQVLPYKGLDNLLKALAEMHTDKKMRFVVSANWRHVDKQHEYQHLLDAVAARFALEDYDEITPVDKFIDLACGCDLWVLPYRTASTSFTGMVAMRYGTPLLVSNVGTFPEMLGEELREWVVPPDDVHSLQDALTRYVNKSPSERTEIGRFLFDKAQREHGWSAIAQTTMGIYERLSN